MPDDQVDAALSFVKLGCELASVVGLLKLKGVNALRH
jgi:hypothetical protein